MKTKVFIICRDRLEPLQQLLEWVSDQDVYLVDNASTYGPMKKFLKEMHDSGPHRVYYANHNYGHTSPWKCKLVPRNERYVVTDPDVVPDENCPRDFLKTMHEILDAAPDLQKVGFGLRIDDLPDHYIGKESVIKHENGFWGCRRDVLGIEGHEVPIDTTFALHREGVRLPEYCSPSTDIWPALRLGFPFVARHLPWYNDSANPSQEDMYYKNHANRRITNWLADEVSDSHK